MVIPSLVPRHVSRPAQNPQYFDLIFCPLLLLCSPAQAQGRPRPEHTAPLHEALEVAVLRIQNLAQVMSPGAAPYKWLRLSLEVVVRSQPGLKSRAAKAVKAEAKAAAEQQKQHSKATKAAVNAARAAAQQRTQQKQQQRNKSTSKSFSKAAEASAKAAKAPAKQLQRSKSSSEEANAERAAG